MRMLKLYLVIDFLTRVCFFDSLDGLPFQNEEFDFVYVIFFLFPPCMKIGAHTKCIIGILNG